ncbi:MAG: glycosyl transferase family protein [Polaromonas sp.]|nr:glycosyl transferase family protein [Polaromonas sp.]
MAWNPSFMSAGELAFSLVAFVLLALLLVSLLDDVLVDIWYWLGRGRRSNAQAVVPSPLSASEVTERGEQPLAVLVTAWQEPNALTAMLDHLRSDLLYRNHTIFVGVYPNDTDTVVALERVMARRTGIVRIDVPHLGPTCRADNLNWVFEGVVGHEAENAVQFAGYVLHAGGDLLHPLALAYFNYLLPRIDVIQLPVASAPQPLWALVAGSVMDEHAQFHGKDMVLRQRAGIVASAGVGLCLSHRAVQALIRLTCAKPFDVGSLADDCGIGKALARLDLRTLYGVFPVEAPTPHGSANGQAGSTPQVAMAPLAVRSAFPGSFTRAYRNKARRLLDLLVQSPKPTRQPPSLAARYLLLRERKILVTAFLVPLLYLLALVAALNAGRVSGVLWTGLVLTVIGLMLIRLGQRVYFTTRLYGWQHGLMALPRTLVGHAVDLMSAARAWRRYMAHKHQGKKLTWDKTTQTPMQPGAAAKRSQRRLGEVLQAWKAVDGDALNEALREQQATHLPLGRILVSNGWLDEETLAEAIAYQTDLPRAQLDAELVQAHAGYLPLHIGTLHRAVYIGLDAAQCPLLAVASPLPQPVLDALGQLFGAPPRQRIVRESEVAIALRLLRGAQDSFTPIRDGIAGVPLLGDMLIEQSLLSRTVFEAALENYRPERHGRLGDFLVERGVILREVIERVVRQQRLMHAEVMRPGR